MKRLSILLIFIMLRLAFAIDHPTYDKNKHTMSNWESQATTHLNITSAALLSRKNNRCIMLNNYWCLKDFGWSGSIGKDDDTHSAFVDGYYAARAAVRNARSAYIKHGRKSAHAIMEAYAPLSDCIGSNRARRADGTCIHGKNDPTVYSKMVAKGITNDIKSDLFLFDKDGKATDNLVLFLQNMSAYELSGPRVQDATIKKGICLEDSSCKP